MTKKFGFSFKALAFMLTVLLALSLCSCSGTQKRRALEDFSDTLRGNYQSSVSFLLDDGEIQIHGSAEIKREGAVTSLDILSPEPYSGMSIQYDIKGLPSSVAVHFSGMDTDLPVGALSKINTIAAIFADDFADSLSKLPAEGLVEYQASDGMSGYCASVVHGDADITVYFSADGSIPLLMEYRSEDISADIIFDSFMQDVKR